MNAADWMTKDPVTVNPSQTLADAHLAMKKHGIRHLPVVENARLVGMITDRDIRSAAPSTLDGSMPPEKIQALLQGISVESSMIRKPVTVSVGAPLLDAVRLMAKHKFGAIPVVDSDKLVGIVSQIDALHALMNLLERRPSA